MQISELEEQLYTEGLLSAHVGENVKKFVLGEKVFSNNRWKNLIDVFGIYKGGDGRFCFFITDSERGVPEYTDVFLTEGEACEALLKKIARAERIYQKSIR